MGEMKPTPGPWVIAQDTFVYALNEQGCNRFSAHVQQGYSSQKERTPFEELEANARLIAEAGTVFHNTGLSPVQLVEMVKEMEVALRGLVSALSPEIQGSPNSPLEIARAALAKCEGVGND